MATNGVQHLELIDPLANCRRRRNERLRRAVRRQLERAGEGYARVHPGTALAASLGVSLQELQARVSELAAVPATCLDRLALTQAHARCSDLAWLTREVAQAQDTAESAHSLADAAHGRLVRQRHTSEVAQQRLARERADFAVLSARLDELDQRYCGVLTHPPADPGVALSRLARAYAELREDARSLAAA